MNEGYLAGEYPGGTTTVEGVPTSATVRILYRPESGQPGDGELVAQVQSAPDGTWRVEGLRTDLLYDVVGRKEGFNDVIVSGVTPTSMVDITYSGAVVENETFTGADGYLLIVGGIPPYSVAAEPPLPAGLFPVMSGRNLIIDGTTGADEVATFDVKVTSSNGAEKIIPLQLVVGFKAPQNFASEVILDDDVFTVALTWEVTNSTQQVKVYRSETPFDLDDLPEPIATLAGASTTYTDDDVIEDDHFYYMVAAVCEQYELRSNVITELVNVVDPHWDNVVALLHFDGDMSDETGRIWQSTQGEVSFIASGGPFDGPYARFESASYSSTPSLTLASNEPLTVESFVRVRSADPGIGTQAIVALHQQTTRRISYYHAMGGALFRIYQRPSVPDTSNDRVLMEVDLTQDEWIHIAYVRYSDKHSLFFDGVEVASSAVAPISLNPLNIFLGESGGGTEYLTGDVAQLRITKGVARYTENFTPPAKPFPNK